MNDAAAIDLGAVEWETHARDWLFRKSRTRSIKLRSHIKDGVLVLRPRMRDWREWIVFASGKANYYISKLLNQFWNATSYSFPATLYFGLWTTTLTAASTGSSGTETTYTGYARVAMTANTTNFPTSAGGAAIQNAVAVTFGQDTVGTPTITYVAVLDASSAGNLLYWGSITSITLAVNEVPQINVNGLTASEA